MNGLSVGAFGTNCWILPIDPVASSETGPCILVDPGADSRRILALLDAHSFRPLLIACTHGHLDHILAIGDLVAAFGERGTVLPVAIHHLDASYLGPSGETRNRALFEAIGARSMFERLWSSQREADLLFDDGDALAASDWRVLHCPGHSAGSVCFYHEHAGLLVSGDTLFRDGVGRTDGQDSDEKQLHASIADRLFSLPAATRVFPGHGSTTIIGRERGDAPGD